MNNVNLAVNSYLGSERRRWITCLAAARFVGSYSSETLETANRLGVDASTIENFAAAGKAWRVLSLHMTRQERGQVRISAFTFCWPLFRDGKADPVQIADIMRDAIAENVKTKDLTDRIAAENGKPERKHNPLVYLNGLFSWLEKSHLPDKQRRAALKLLQELREIIKEEEE